MYSIYNYSTIKLNNILHNYKIYIFISVQKLSYELNYDTPSLNKIQGLRFSTNICCGIKQIQIVIYKIPKELYKFYQNHKACTGNVIFCSVYL